MSEEIPPIVFDIHGFEPNSKLIGAALETPDAIGKILRVHLAIEQQLNALIRHLTGLDVGRQSFYSKLITLKTVLQGDWACDAIQKVNSLRNQLAHNPNSTFQDSRNLAAEIVAICTEEMPPIKEMKVRLHKGESTAVEFTSLEIDQQVAVVGAMLAAYLGNMPKYKRFHRPTFAVPPDFQYEPKESN